ncbi:MAG: heme NO-binding domain-containing protein [Planctomycetota bacterium]
MYGLVNRAIEDLVCQNHGQETWERVRARAGVTGHGFVAMESYPDAITYALVGAAAEELGAPADEILEAFGEFWMKYTAEEGYGELLGIMGSTFDEFMDNLDSMHARIAATMPHLVPPSFTREATPEGATILHYESERKGLAPMVIGLLKGLSTRFNVKFEVEHLAPVGEGHERFLITRSD